MHHPPEELRDERSATVGPFIASSAATAAWRSMESAPLILDIPGIESGDCAGHTGAVETINATAIQPGFTDSSDE